MNERIAAGEIYVGLDDEAAIAGLRRVEAEFGRTMQRIEHEKATVELRATEDRLKRDLELAKRDVRKYERYVKEADTSLTRSAREKSLAREKQKEKEARGALKAHQLIMRAQSEQDKAEARSAAKQEAIFRRQQQRQRILEQAERRRLLQLRQLDQFNARMSKQREREMQSAHGDALRMNRDIDNQALAVARLQRQYSEAHDTLRKLNSENRRLGSRLLRSPDSQQKVDLNITEAEARMVKLEGELRALGARPIHQKVELDVDNRGLGQLDRWAKAITDTTVRVGPFTTTIAGLSRTLLLLGPILSGLVGQFAALGAVVGAGLGGAIGVTAGAVGALGVSLGGVGFLLPSLLRDFKGLNTIQKAYHTQVLKTGANSDKAKTKLQEYNHALGEVAPTTRKAFLTLNELQDRWRGLSRLARPTFFHMLGESIDTLNHQFDWFQKNTLGAFAELDKGWSKWMKGLRSSEADEILTRLGRNGNKSIAPLMSGLGHLATFIGRVAAAFSDKLPGLLHGFDTWAKALEGTTDNADKLDKRTQLLVGSLQSLGHFAQAAGRVIVAFFAPGVDDGTTMVDNWAKGLNNLADTMNTTGRAGIDRWFRQSIQLANQFWSALKPLAQVFFEWTTIMRPFTVVALRVLGILSNMVQALSNFAPTRAILVGAFGIFLAGALLKRVATVAEGMWSIARAIGAIKAAGGIGAAIKGGLIRFASGGLAGRGSTPANPLFVSQVGGGGGIGGGGKGGGPAAGPGGGLISQLPKFVKVAGGITAIAGAVVGLTAAVDALEKKKSLAIMDKRVQKLVGKRDMSGLLGLKNYLQTYGGNNKEFIKQVDLGINAIDRLDNQDIHRLTGSINSDYDRLKHESKVTFSRVSNLANYHFDLIARTTQKGSHAAAVASARNFGRAKDSIQSAMKAGTISTKKGLGLIESLWVKALEGFGYSPKAARALSHRKPGSTQTPGANGELRPNARGGLYQVGAKGQAGPDSVPMSLGGVPSVVAPGEQIAVFNRHQQRKMAKTYPGGLEGFFSGPQPKHYQGGGIVPVPGFPGERAASSVIPMIEKIAHTWGLILTDAFGSGHQSPGHTVTGTAADFSGPDRAMDAAVAALVKAGYLVGYDGRFGSQNWPGHGPSTRTPNFHFHVELGGKGGSGIAALAPTLDRIVMQSDLGVVSGAGQAALDTAHGAAQANLDAVAQAALSAATAGGAGVAVNAGQIRAWITAGLELAGQQASSGAIATLFGRIMQESGGNPRAQNNWDSNAKAGHPSKGILQTIDSTFNTYKVPGHNDIWNPIDNIAAAVNYMLAQYHRLVGASGSGYAKGGIVTMGENEWARGGKVERPTLMTGEDKGKHPEFVIGTNPMFKSSNLDTLRAAASALGIPQARKSKKSKHPKKHSKPMASVIEDVGPGGKDVAKLSWVQRYSKLQGKEDDTNRDLSIATSKVKEPGTFIKKVGTDESGADLYSVDENAINGYWGQLNAVKVLYDKLVGKGGILDRMVNAANKAFVQITNYISARQDNIRALNNNIRTDRGMTHSKDEDTRKAAEKRLAKDVDKRDRERQKVGDARDARSTIREDQHDAGYRRQEYAVSLNDLLADMLVLRTNAAAEAADANPQPDTTTPEPDTPDTGPSILEQIATYSTARQELYSSMGSNITGVGPGSPGRGPQRPTFGSGITNAPGTRVALSTPTASIASALAGGATAASAGTRYATDSGVRGGRSGLEAAMAGGGTGMLSGDTSSTSVNIENVNFPIAPTDAHTFSRNLLWEIKSL